MPSEPRSESPYVIVSPYVPKGTVVRFDRAVYGLGVVLVFHDDEDHRIWFGHPERRAKA